MEQGIIQVYTGPGKGKTTAATGLIVRALGQGLKVLLVRFLKPLEPPSSELRVLETQSNLEIVTAGLGGIDARRHPEALRENVSTTFEQVLPKILSGRYDLVVLDEINGCLARGYLPLDAMLELFDQRPVGTELVLTGRDAPEDILLRADLVTDMVAQRHPFEKGLPARPGIEF